MFCDTQQTTKCCQRVATALHTTIQVHELTDTYTQGFKKRSITVKTASTKQHPKVSTIHRFNAEKTITYEKPIQLQQNDATAAKTPLKLQTRNFPNQNMKIQIKENIPYYYYKF